MSKHWRPDRKGVSRGRRDWARAGSYGLAGARQRLSAGAKAGLILVGAACLGLSAGLYQAFAPVEPVPPEAEIEWGEVQGVPTREADAEDAAWEQRAKEQGSPSTSTGRTGQAVRARFGYCPTGGGSNCVIDGDTFWIGGAKVRIAGIDAPETHPPRCAQEAQLGEAATDKLRALLNSGAVTMTSIDRDRDQYGRLLRNVAVDGADVGEAMVGAGVAR